MTVMDDLISRQAAIASAISGRVRTLPTSEGGEDWIRKSEVRESLLNLPSVQPEPSDVARDIATIIENEKDMRVIASEPQWIPVTERLPEDDTLMLVNYIDNRPDAADIWIGWHEMENVWYIDGEEHSEELGNEVVAWMPLPEPYCGAKMEEQE